MNSRSENVKQKDLWSPKFNASKSLSELQPGISEEKDKIINTQHASWPQHACNMKKMDFVPDSPVSSTPSSSTTITPNTCSLSSSSSSTSYGSDRQDFYPNLPLVRESPRSVSISNRRFVLKENFHENEMQLLDEISCNNFQMESQIQNLSFSCDTPPMQVQLPEIQDQYKSSIEKTNKTMSSEKNGSNTKIFLPLFPSVAPKVLGYLKSNANASHNILASGSAERFLHKNRRFVSGGVFEDQWKSPYKPPDTQKSSSSSTVDLQYLYKILVSIKNQPLAQSQLKLFSALKIPVTGKLDKKQAFLQLNQRLQKLWEETPHLQYYGPKNEFTISKLRLVPEVLICKNDSEILENFSKSTNCNNGRRSIEDEKSNECKRSKLF